MVAVTYRDIDQTLKNNYVDNIYDIEQSIVNLLTTRKKQLLFNSAYGSDVEQILFKPYDESVKLLLLSTIVEAIVNWEPRVRLNQSKTVIEYEFSTKTYWVTLVYDVIIDSAVITTNTQEFGLTK